ncbi:DUF2255 family protein [Sphingobacterium sp.]|uniref:DUF2255 family protein n=1 Tax=Sphingobacterium sp. TaxID=341027 RepID=UPI0028977E6A|nr:DUF2255 family protein [Sphingobacterium sp.]
MNTENVRFSDEELQNINKADDLKISPLRSDGITYGTPTWIWEVVVDGNLYVRAYNGSRSSWYQSAVKQKSGRIHAAGFIWDVVFEPVHDELINTKIDEAYRSKYRDSPYLSPMISEPAKAATIKIIPKSRPK